MVVPEDIDRRYSELELKRMSLWRKKKEKLAEQKQKSLLKQKHMMSKLQKNKNQTQRKIHKK